jgi:2-keto-3-deoxy-L-rhamnonate aldolase RhmA
MSRLACVVKEHGAPLLGIAAYFYDPIFVEIAAKLGFRVLRIEMEHAFIIFAQAADLCRIASGVGMLTTHARVSEADATCMRSARKHGKLVAVGSPLPEVQFWADQQVDILFCGNDVACLRMGAQTILKQATAAIQNRKESTSAR